MPLVRELARGLEPLTCCFSAGCIGAHWLCAVVWRLAWSEAARTPIVFDHLAIVEPESVGQSVGRELGHDRLRVVSFMHGMTAAVSRTEACV
jgi:hypothetical protein